MKSIRSNQQTNSHLAKRWKVKEEKSYSCPRLRNFFYLVNVISVDRRTLIGDRVISGKKVHGLLFTIFLSLPSVFTYNFYLKWIKCKYTFTEKLWIHIMHSAFWYAGCYIYSKCTISRQTFWSKAKRILRNATQRKEPWSLIIDQWSWIYFLSGNQLGLSPQFQWRSTL